MSVQKHLRFLLGLLYAALAIGAASLLLPGILPFLLGWLISCLLEPVVRFFSQKTSVHRNWVAAAILLLFFSLLGTGGFFLLRRLWYEMTLLSTQLPAWMEFFQGLFRRLDTLVYRWTVAVSPNIRAMLQNALTQLSDQAGSLISSLGTALLEQGAAALLSLPRVVLFLFTALLSCYFFLAYRPALAHFLQQTLPHRWLQRLAHLFQKLKEALGGWLRAQGILMAVTFVLLGTGFLLMGAEPAILLAAGVALLDALPVFGTGTVLLPWALFCLLSSNLQRAIALAVLYAALWLTRSLLEPRLIAARAGLHPLAALFSMYLGFTLFGVAGMLLAPLCVVLLWQLFLASPRNLHSK